MREIDGDLIELANSGRFDVITHGANCFCTMGAGIAPQMARAFGCDKFPMEDPKYRGDINKLGTIDYKSVLVTPVMKPIKIAGVEIDAPDYGGHPLIVVNSYTQFRYGSNHADGYKMPVDYDAIRLCMRKINYLFSGKTIGLPKIGSGLAGGDWNIIRGIIIEELPLMDICIVNYKKT
jgi:O-acetyl-ADP-ribose deacetylase (regulator of RNase III)